MTIDIGAAAPDFTLIDDQGTEVGLSDLTGSRLVIYFYPAAFTPGCTAESCDFRDRSETLRKAGYEIVGISPDPASDLARFRAELGLPFRLLSDPDHTVAAAYGAWGTKTNYGREYEGLIRSTFVVGTEGKIEKAWRNVRAKGHTARVERRAALIRFLALGDSYTLGEGVDASQSWPAQLTALLGQVGAKTDVTSVAQTGWTASELAEAVTVADPEPPFDLVSLQVGVNDQYRGLEVEDYIADLRRLLARAIGFAAGSPKRVIVLSIPDWTVTPHGAERDRKAEAKAVVRFNRRLSREARGAGCHWVDVTDLSRLAGPDPSLLTGDELHPSAEMYELWADLLLPTVSRALEIG